MNPDNEGLEKALRESLRREAAPADFAARILARTAAPARVARPWLRRPFTLALAAALAAAAIIPAVVMDHQRRRFEQQEEARGLKAKQDLLTALAITQNQFRQAREKIQRTTRHIQ